MRLLRILRGILLTPFAAAGATVKAARTVAQWVKAATVQGHAETGPRVWWLAAGFVGASVALIVWIL